MSYNEQERVLMFEEELCRRILPFTQDIGAGGDVYDRMGNDPDLPHYWRLRHSHDQRKRTEVIFRGIGYIGSKREYGDPSVFEEPSEEAGERERISTPPEGLKRVITREVRAREEMSTDYKGSVSFSITNTDKASAKASGGVDGVGKVEASAEHETTTSLKTDFGWAAGQKASKETILRGELSLNIPGNEIRILTTNVSRVKEVRPFSDIAYLDCEIDIDLYDWSGDYSDYIAWRGRHDNVIHSANIQDLIWLMEGKRPVEYPDMGHFLKECSQGSTDFYNWLKDQENRKVEIEGQRVRYYPGALDIDVRVG